MGLAAGTRLGVYEIVALIGAGGMGEVYRARDSRLDRHVAIKSLSDALRADPDRAARFAREAKLLATLNHPNIATIYGLEQSDADQFIVMELVEGETLADRMGRGPIPPSAATFATAKRLASWVVAYPGHDESAGINHSHRSPNGNRQMRRLLNQAANAAVKTKGSIFELVCRRLVIRLGHAQAIGAIAHRLCRLVWKILYDGVAYQKRGPAVIKARAQRRAAKTIRELRSPGYCVEPRLPPARTPA